MAASDYTLNISIGRPQVVGIDPGDRDLIRIRFPLTPEPTDPWLQVFAHGAPTPTAAAGSCCGSLPVATEPALPDPIAATPPGMVRLPSSRPSARSGWGGAWTGSTTDYMYFSATGN
jgi:hypothetical protein